MARVRDNSSEQSAFLHHPLWALSRSRAHSTCVLSTTSTAGCSLGFIGHTALHWAASKNYIPLIRWLISEGLPVNVPNNGGSTPLHTAGQCGHTSAVSALIDAGGDASLTNEDGQTAYTVCMHVGGTRPAYLHAWTHAQTRVHMRECTVQVAVERGHSEAAKLIHVAGAKAALPSVLSEMASREESTWKVGCIHAHAHTHAHGHTRACACTRWPLATP